MITTNCEVVLNFPALFAGIIIFFDAAIDRNPVIKNSLAIIVITIHAGTSRNGISTKHIKAADINNLSASGSKNIPISVIALFLLAIRPSKKSVIAAKQNIISARILLKIPSISIKKIKQGTMHILATVSLFGIFINFSLIEINLLIICCLHKKTVHNQLEQNYFYKI
jgi:hypothetical protein